MEPRMILQAEASNTVTQEDVRRLQRFYDMGPEYPRVDWAAGLKHLPVKISSKMYRGRLGSMIK